MVDEVKGTTFKGISFNVPETKDMIQALFNPKVPKSHFEKLILIVLLINSYFLIKVGNMTTKICIFVVLYLFWRICYNIGIGYALHQQSNHSMLVEWAKSVKVFDKKNTSTIAKLIRAEIKSQMGPDYDIFAHPIEFNTWLVFRKIVDFVLIQDFAAFICLVICCGINKNYQFINIYQQSPWLVGRRLLIGTSLVLFNLWAKISAHNIIKDYAWYWGDFFFRKTTNKELIFEGIFKIIPHPMYSIGYIGYYGFALVSKSYTVLILSIFGHMMQMIFLYYVENPHISKIYGPSVFDSDDFKSKKHIDTKYFNETPLVGLINFHIFRATDILNLIIICTYSIIIPFFAFLIGNFNEPFKVRIRLSLFCLTVVIRFFGSVLINYLTKLCLVNNIPIAKLFKNWVVFYNTIINLIYSSFIGQNFYYILIGLENPLVTSWLYLRFFLGLFLIVIQVWVNALIIDSIGYFGWFHGDLFIPNVPKLSKVGIYRYLNNPQRIFGAFGVIGITIIFPSIENIFHSVLWVINDF